LDDNAGVNFWTKKRAPFLSLKLGILNIDNKRRQETAWSDELFSCVLSHAFTHQCVPAASMIICCAREDFAGDQHAVALDGSNKLLNINEEDGFLQKPLVDIVGDFFRERRKRRQGKRRERKRGKPLGG
jgi:hypothetical protein